MEADREADQGDRLVAVSVSGLKLRVRVDGLAGVLRSLQGVGLDLSDLDMAPIGRVGARLVTHYAPVRSGRLAGTTRAGKPGKNRITIRSGTGRVPYAAPINYGWPSRGIAPAGYMQKAGDALETLAVPLISREVARLIAARGLG
jgi:hypothetical protein